MFASGTGGLLKPEVFQQVMRSYEQVAVAVGPPLKWVIINLDGSTETKDDIDPNGWIRMVDQCGNS